ncbi:hypothetical protein, conserved [Eimeria necatrix]|uniref:ER membrane protein complex subunit 7 beta-sandwich domain-containing protein n=1 Tax=Eimeria necatrix TaxID=51315 RepID=U6MKC0_9EIME|nr:hypothetical protein, conserved [Eimeria necatrix]CDJ64682.1 hypothetical protein, conserved [Eimeria necatrix]
MVCRLFLGAVALSVCMGTLRASDAPQSSTSIHMKAEEVWGHVFCDPVLMPSLTIALNGTPLGNTTLLPAFHKSPAFGRSTAVGSYTTGSPSLEFRLPPLLPGSYLLEVLHPSLIFPKYRVVTTSSSSEVYLLNEYVMPTSLSPLPMPVTVAPTGVPRYFPAQGGFSIFDLLRQPLVILVLVSLGIMYFLRKMQEAQTEAESQQQEQELPEQQAVDSLHQEAPESAFVAKLIRQGGH